MVDVGAPKVGASAPVRNANSPQAGGDPAH